jgi:hypothetical protein
MLRRCCAALPASSPHQAAVDSLHILGKVLFILFLIGAWVIVIGVVALAGAGVVAMIRESPVAVIVGFLVMGAVISWLAAFFVSTWGIDLLVGAGGSAAVLGLLALNRNS